MKDKTLQRQFRIYKSLNLRYENVEDIRKIAEEVLPEEHMTVKDIKHFFSSGWKSKLIVAFVKYPPKEREFFPIGFTEYEVVDTARLTELVGENIVNNLDLQENSKLIYIHKIAITASARRQLAGTFLLDCLYVRYLSKGFIPLFITTVPQGNTDLKKFLTFNDFMSPGQFNKTKVYSTNPNGRNLKMLLSGRKNNIAAPFDI